MSIEIGGLNRIIRERPHGKRPVIVVGTETQGLAKQAYNETYPPRRPDILRPQSHVSYADKLRAFFK